MSERNRILVADDDPASAELLTYFLESHGFQVSTANDGNRALEMGTSGDYQLVILDVHMPSMDASICCSGVAKWCRRCVASVEGS